MQKGLLNEQTLNNLQNFTIDVDCVEDPRRMLETLEFVEYV